MQRKELETGKELPQAQQEKRAESSKHIADSKHVSDHLANERTFLAWLRTGIATIAFGFVVARFGLLLRELAVKNQSGVTVYYSSEFGVALTLLGVVLMILALLNFLRNRRMIDADAFRPAIGFAIVLTVLVGLIGVLLAVYLFFTG